MYLSCEQEQKKEGNDALNKNRIRMSWHIKTPYKNIGLVVRKIYDDYCELKPFLKSNTNKKRGLNNIFL